MARPRRRRGDRQSFRQPGRHHTHDPCWPRGSPRTTPPSTARTSSAVTTDRPALTEYYYDTANGNGIPTWAAVRTSTYLYVEYYGNTNATNTTPTFREYYDMVNDPYQLINLYNDGNRTNDPNTAVLSAQLAALKNCSGAACT